VRDVRLTRMGASSSANDLPRSGAYHSLALPNDTEFSGERSEPAATSG
jgi:hypothetical protein